MLAFPLLLRDGPSCSNNCKKNIRSSCYRCLLRHVLVLKFPHFLVRLLSARTAIPWSQLYPFFILDQYGSLDALCLPDMQLGTEEIAHTHRVPILPLFSLVHLMTQGRNYLGKKNSPPPQKNSKPSKECSFCYRDLLQRQESK